MLHLQCAMHENARRANLVAMAATNTTSPGKTGIGKAAHQDRVAKNATATKTRLIDTFAQKLAKSIARVVEVNVVDRAGVKVQIFRMNSTGSRLDTQAAAFVARHGLKAQVVEDWLSVANLPKQGFYGGLRLSPSTLSRKSKGDTLDPAVTERLVRQSDLMVKAAEVFGEGAGKWLTKPHPLLGGQTPIDAASNEYGGTKVRQILNAIEHGGTV